MNAISASIELVTVESSIVNNDWNFTGPDLFPVCNIGMSIHAAIGNEDSMAFISLDTGTDFGFLNGRKRKNIIPFKKLQA